MACLSMLIRLLIAVLLVLSARLLIPGPTLTTTATTAMIATLLRRQSVRSSTRDTAAELA
jgi:hypothetical protein